MYNLLISLGIGIAVGLGVHLAGLSVWAGIVPGLLAFILAFILLARRVSKHIQKLMDAVQKEFASQATNQKDAQAKVERAVKTLEQGLVYDKWQIMVGPELHAQIGMLKYMVKDLDGAQVHFARSGPRNYMAKAMEGALHYQRKNYTAMERAFEDAVKNNGKKESVIWAAYAWCLLQIKEKDKALRVLGRAVVINPSDEKLKGSLSQLQNDKRLKMKPYEPTWWQFGLEAPPPPTMGGGGGGRRMQFITRR